MPLSIDASLTGNGQKGGGEDTQKTLLGSGLEPTRPAHVWPPYFRHVITAYRHNVHVNYTIFKQLIYKLTDVTLS